MCICVGALFYLCVHRNVISTRSENFAPNSFPSGEGGKIAVINLLANWLIEKSENIVWRRNCEIGKIGKIMENGFLCQLCINLLCFSSIWDKINLWALVLLDINILVFSNTWKIQQPGCYWLFFYQSFISFILILEISKWNHSFHNSFLIEKQDWKYS